MKLVISTHNLDRDFYISDFFDNFIEHKNIEKIEANEDGVITVELKNIFKGDTIETLIREIKTVLGDSFFSIKIS